MESITSKDDATVMALMRIEEEAQPYIQDIETRLTTDYIPDSIVTLRLRPYGTRGRNIDKPVANYIADMYAKVGWTTEVKFEASDVTYSVTLR